MQVSRSLCANSGAAILLALLGLAACAPAATPVSPTLAPTAAPPAVASATPVAALPVATAPIPVTGANAMIKVARIQGFGLFLSDNAGRTLYAFANDTKDTSNCTGNCVQNWPPFTAPSLPQGDTGINMTLLGMSTRPEGTMQVTYDGHPLYYYSGDKNPGDVKGHGIGNVWHVLSPRGNPMTNPAPPTSTSTP
jgi:predicted lipoprotein with Yx(FWY)xxD motif